MYVGSEPYLQVKNEIRVQKSPFGFFIKEKFVHILIVFKKICYMFDNVVLLMFPR